ncbi:MAG: hypothetical protein U5K37_03490 [Natrialbaceae archaeon]|nr:hypothetical protein [Natrialbaceae archaeon]
MVESDRESEVGLLATRAVKEVVDRGLETSLREPIVEAVEESDAGSSSRGIGLPLSWALLAGAGAIGFAAGRRSAEFLEGVVPEEVEIEPELEVEIERGGDSGWKLAATGTRPAGCRRRTCTDPTAILEQRGAGVGANRGIPASTGHRGQ